MTDLTEIELVTYVVEDGLATILIANPPVNALGQAVRRGVLSALGRALVDDEVGVILLAADGRSWPVGADIREFGTVQPGPSLPDLCAALAAASKPVIAALHGSALGGGLELALACALRVAAPGTVLGLPEVTLGLLPGAGGTQRLPRLAGLDLALEMMLGGKPISAERALQAGLIDRIAVGDLLAFVRAIAWDHVDGRATMPVAALRRHMGLADPAAYLTTIAAARAVQRAPHELAAQRIIDCAEAALLLPPVRGMIFERTAFQDLVQTPVARALRHAFFAERGAAHSLPAAARKSDFALRHLAIVGGGPIGAGIAVVALAAGLEVTLVGRDPPNLATGLARVARLQDGAMARGSLAPAQREADWARLRAVAGMGALADVDLLIETVSDAENQKETVLRAINAALPEGRPVLSVTCGRAPDALAVAVGRPAHHASLWLSEPISRAGLVEIVAPDAALAALQAAQVLATRLGWRLLRHGPQPGFHGRRFWTAFQDAADHCLAFGALPHEIDRALRSWGLPQGAFERADVFGLDHVLFTRPERRAGVLANPIAETLRIWMRAQGRLGRAAERGYYDYRADGTGARTLDPVIAAELAHLRAHQPLADATIVRRIIAALANDGAWAITEGCVRKPADIDLVALGARFPRWRGGVMQVADELGLLGLRNILVALAGSGDGYWTPAPLWDELIREGRRFADLNGG